MKEIHRQYGYVGLHMGCGPLRYPAYLNCDIDGGEFYVDATRPFPMRDSCLDYVYSEHLIEHLPYDGALSFLKESFRVLRQGGIFRCLMPDFSLLLKVADSQPELAGKIEKRRTEGAFSEDGVQLFGPRISAEQALLWDNRDDICNGLMRDWGHKYLWSASHLARAAEYVGLREVQVLPFGVSSDDRICLELEDRWGREWTSVVEARK
jgi:SAM-dependent methyltransferase